MGRHGNILMGMLCISGVSWSAFTHRQRVVFRNDAPEDVYVSVSNHFIKPLDKWVVYIGEQTNFFALEFSPDRPLFVCVETMSQGLQSFVLRLTRDITQSNKHICQAYGEVILARTPYVEPELQSMFVTPDELKVPGPDELELMRIGAGSVQKSILLTYTKEGDLVVGNVAIYKRPRLPNRGRACKKKSCFATEQQQIKEALKAEKIPQGQPSQTSTPKRQRGSSKRGESRCYCGNQ